MQVGETGRDVVRAADDRTAAVARGEAAAHRALLGFLRSAHRAQARLVLVITGKGTFGTGERGALKRQVPMWLNLPEFRAIVVGFESAAIGHGGEGALYVRLRKKRS